MNQLKVNQSAPSFSARDYKGAKISLEQFKGKKVLLSFHAFASCPFCNLRVNETKNKQAAWRAQGLEVMHVFPSQGDNIGKFAGKDNPPFTIIADPDKNLYPKYAVKTSFSGMMAGFLKVSKLIKALKVVGMYDSLRYNDAAMHQLPADFLIDENGIIQEAYYSKANGDNLPLERVDAFAGEQDVAA